MSTNPYAPPASATKLGPAKRPFFKSGARILFVAFLLPLLAQLMPLMKALFMLLTSPPGAGGIVGPVYKYGVPRPYPWNIDRIGNAGIESIKLLAFACVPIGLMILSQNPRVRTQQLSWSFRATVVAVSVIFAIFAWAAGIAWFFQTELPFSPLFYDLQLIMSTTRWITLVAVMLLIRKIALLGRNAVISQLATVSSFMTFVGFAIAEADSMGTPGQAAYGFTVLFFLPQQVLMFATLWSARKLEDPPSKAPQRKKRDNPKHRAPPSPQDNSA